MVNACLKCFSKCEQTTQYVNPSTTVLQSHCASACLNNLIRLIFYPLHISVSQNFKKSGQGC